MLRQILLTLCLGAFASAALPPGKPLQDAPITLVDGKKLDLKQYRGKALLLALVSTDCEHCDHALSFLNIVQKESGPLGLQVVAAAGDVADGRSLAVYAAKHTTVFPFGFLDRNNFLKTASLAPDARPFVPILMFIDAYGVVRVQILGDNPMMEKMEVLIRSTVRELLKEPGLKK